MIFSWNMPNLHNPQKYAYHLNSNWKCKQIAILKKKVLFLSTENVDKLEKISLMEEKNAG